MQPGIASSANNGHLVDPLLVEKLLSPGSFLAEEINGYEFREQQAEMACLVARAFNEKKFLLVEGGTGIGKTLAYLLPAVIWLNNGGPRVLVATRTINLQEQIWHKDLPMVFEMLNTSVKAALAKGRQNYLCLRKWRQSEQESHPAGIEELFIRRIRSWLSDTTTGDKSELNLSGQEDELWHYLCSQGDECGFRECRFRGACFITKARRELEPARIIITNHSLLLADTKTSNSVLPLYGPLVVDEAHHLENAATEQLGKRVTRGDIRRWLAQAEKTIRCLWIIAPASDAGKWMDRLVQLRESISILNLDSDSFFNALKSWISGGVSEEGEIVRRFKSRDLFLDGDGLPVAEYASLHNSFRETVYMLDDTRHILSNWACENNAWRDREEEIDNLHCAGEGLLGDLKSIMECQEEENAYWVALGKQPSRGQISLNAAPVKIGGSLYRLLFEDRESVVFTSATITVEDKFDFFEERTGISLVNHYKVIRRQLDSPFDYEKQSLLCIVKDLPDQGSNASDCYVREISRAIIRLVRAIDKKTLVLFTSHRILKDVYYQIKGENGENSSLKLLGQDIDGSRTGLVEEFIGSEKAVLLGTASFWEGVDIPGDDLNAVIIVKLPFHLPSVPIIEARLEELGMEGRNSFCDYYLPMAVMRFKQGFGRLIRTKNDTGAVIVLDKRLVLKNYGPVFLNSLPLKDHFTGSLEDVIIKTKSWTKS